MEAYICSSNIRQWGQQEGEFKASLSYTKVLSQIKPSSSPPLLSVLRGFKQFKDRREKALDIGIYQVQKPPLPVVC